MARTGRVVLFIFAVAAACTGFPPAQEIHPPPPLPDMPGIVRHVALTTPSGPDACAQLEQLIEDQAVAAMRVDVENARRLASTPTTWVDAGSSAGADGGSAGPGGPGGGSYSTTNLQTAGVDEADVMKNDGTRLFTFSGNELVTLRTWPDSQLQVMGRLALGAPPRELLLAAADELIVFSSDYGSVRATFVDVSRLADPRVVGQIDLPGEYLTARRVGTAIRVVLRGQLEEPYGLQYFLPPGSSSDDAAYAALEAQNEAIIRAQPLAHWLPAARVWDPASGQTREVAHPCDQVSASNAPVTLGLATVATLDASDPTAVDRWSILGHADTVYASATSLYLAGRHWWWYPQAGQPRATYVHRFDISTAATAVHVASGAFDGAAPDSFAFDELDGRLRIAANDDVSNRILVLEPSGRELVEVGRSEDFAPGERLMSARFLGTRAFAVTFRQRDPLFTLDLSNPTAPHVVGALTVPGFSTYLHPVGNSRLVAVGMADGGPQVSLFDVSDLANPVQVSALALTSSGFSPANGDHRAFTWLPAQGLFAVPCQTWSPYAYWSPLGQELRVFRVEPAGLADVGTLSMTDLSPTSWWPAISRSVLTDQDAYAISGSAVRVARLDDLATPLATAITQSGAGPTPPGGPDAGAPTIN